MKDVSEIAGFKPTAETKMSRLYGGWMLRRSLAFQPAAARYFKGRVTAGTGKSE